MKGIGWLAVIGGVLLIVFVLGLGVLVPYGWGRGVGGYGFGWGMMGLFGLPMVGMMAMMGLPLLIFWALIIGGGVWLAQSVARGSSRSSVSPKGESPLDILQKRYFGGEITKEQYETMKRDLGL